MINPEPERCATCGLPVYMTTPGDGPVYCTRHSEEFHKQHVEPRRRSEQLRNILDSVAGHVSGFSFALTASDIGNQEHHHRQAVQWTERLLGELTGRTAAREELTNMCEVLLGLVRLKFGNLDPDVNVVQADAEALIKKARGS